VLPGSHTHRERDHGGCSPFTRRPTRVRPMSPAWMVRRIGDGNICPRRISIEHKSERGRNSCSPLAPHRAYRSPSLSIRCHDHGHTRVFVSPGGRRFDCAWRISRNATASDRLHACVSVVPPATSSDVGRFEFTLVCVCGVCVPTMGIQGSHHDLRGLSYGDRPNLVCAPHVFAHSPGHFASSRVAQLGLVLCELRTLADGCSGWRPSIMCAQDDVGRACVPYVEPQILLSGRGQYAPVLPRVFSNKNGS